MSERARARDHARLRADEHRRVVCAHSIFFELRRKGVAGHRPRALLVWGVPHQYTSIVLAPRSSLMWGLGKQETGPDGGRIGLVGPLTTSRSRTRGTSREGFGGVRGSHIPRGTHWVPAGSGRGAGETRRIKQFSVGSRRRRSRHRRAAALLLNFIVAWRRAQNPAHSPPSVTAAACARCGRRW